MSYSKCFLCREDNYSGNEARITVERKTVDKETLEHTTAVWSAHVCDGCLRKLELMRKAGRTCGCGWHGFIDGWGHEPPNFCPRCGGKVMGR